MNTSKYFLISHCPYPIFSHLIGYWVMASVSLVFLFSCLVWRLSLYKEVLLLISWKISGWTWKYMDWECGCFATKWSNWKDFEADCTVFSCFHLWQLRYTRLSRDSRSRAILWHHGWNHNRLQNLTLNHWVLPLLAFLGNVLGSGTYTLCCKLTDGGSLFEFYLSFSLKDWELLL